MKSLLLGGLVAIATLGLACTGPNRIFANTGGGGGTGQGGGGGQGGDGAGGGHASGLDVTVVPAAPTILRQGSDVVVDVKVDRTGPSSTPATITVSKLPAGVSADPLEIAANAASGHLHLHGTAGAVQGVAGVVVNATAGPLHGSANHTLVVAGAPGTPDASFVDATGTFQTQVGGIGTRGRGLVIQPDGKIVVAGISADSTPSALALRLTDVGAKDGSFATNGVLSMTINGGSGAYSVAIEPSGRLFLGGFGAADFDGNCELALLALHPNGTVDDTFGANGVVTSPPATGCGWVTAVLPDASGVVGIGPFFDAVNTESTALYAYDSMGAPTGNGSGADRMQTGGRQADGKLLYGGIDAANEFALTRLTDVQTTDASFSGGTAFVFFNNRSSKATGLALRSGGQILLGGVSDDGSGGDPRVAFTRINSNGSVDLSFGTGGRALSDVPMWTRATNSFALDSQGRILFGGYVGSPQQPAIARFLPDGTPDPAFGPAGLGYVVLDQLATDPANTNVGVWGIGVDAFDRVVVSGEIGPDSASSLFVARYWF